MSETITSTKDISSSQTESNNEISFTSSETSNENNLNEIVDDKNNFDELIDDQKENSYYLKKLPLISGI